MGSSRTLPSDRVVPVTIMPVISVFKFKFQVDRHGDPPGRAGPGPGRHGASCNIMMSWRCHWQPESR